MHAVALVASSLVHTGGSVLARTRVALVDVVLTAGAVEASRTDALVAAMRVFTRALVLARRSISFVALVDVLLAEVSGEAGPAVASELAHRQLIGLT